MGAGSPLMVGWKSPPVIAMIVADVNSRVGPISVISNTASFSGLSYLDMFIWNKRPSMPPATLNP